MQGLLFCPIDYWDYRDGAKVWRRREGFACRYVAVRADGWVLGTTYRTVGAATAAIVAARKDAG